jgi:hypothetical protein
VGLVVAHLLPDGSLACLVSVLIIKRKVDLLLRLVGRLQGPQECPNTREKASGRKEDEGCESLLKGDENRNDQRLWNCQHGGVSNTMASADPTIMQLNNQPIWQISLLLTHHPRLVDSYFPFDLPTHLKMPSNGARRDDGCISDITVCGTTSQQSPPANMVNKTKKGTLTEAATSDDRGDGGDDHPGE